MPILRIQDTAAFQADYLRNLFGLDTILGTQNSLEYNVIDVTITNQNLMPVKTETVEISLPPNFSSERYEQIISELEGFSLLTHKTSIETPEQDIEENTFNYNNYATDAFSYYNVRNEEYENYTQANDERILPNFCLGALWTRPGSDTNSEQINYYTMFNAIQSLSDSQILAGETPINNYEFDDEFLGDGFDISLEDTVDYYKQMLISGSVFRPQYRDSNSHVYIDFNYNLNDSKQIGNTPFFNRIRLPQLKINNRFETEGPEISMHSIFKDSKMSEKLIKSFRNSNSFLRSFSLNENNSELKVYDLLEMFESISYGENLRDTDEMYLRDPNSDMLVDNNNPFLFYFYKLILLGKLRRKIRARVLNFEEVIVESKNHHTEQIGFKVIKRIEGRNTPIQTFYFLNRSGLQDFVDTQVKFDRVYTYEVIAMTVIYGSSYSYENVVKTRSESETIIRFDFVNTPSVKIVEVPLAFHTLRIVEPPPIVPEITFYNEMTSRNKLKIRMEHQDGNIVDEYMKKPMRPFNGNQGYINKLEQYFSSDNILVTSGKTSDGIYEIYRLDKPPKSYKDFEDALIATVQSNVIYSNGEASRNAMFVDLISHQKKYYYAFRVLTHRGNPSELSPIYVAEMYEDADETFLTFDLYQEPEIKDSQNIYNMRKYMQIIPNFEQTIVNEEELLAKPSADDAVSIVKLGNDGLQEDLWEYNNPDKYIKLRLESKSSGRKMDINLYFKIKTPTN
tara:strand:- start:1863 stop:4067 length:2205 start_codon:yes stop_codon:yes gene_type:complete